MNDTSTARAAIGLPVDWPDQIEWLATIWPGAAREFVDNHAVLGGLAAHYPGGEAATLPEDIRNEILAFNTALPTSGMRNSVESLKSARGHIDNQGTELLVAKDNVRGHWIGAAAENFADFLTRTKGANDELSTIFENISVVTEAYVAVVEKTQHDLASLLAAAARGLEAARLDPWEIAATVVGAVAGVVGTALSGGGAAPVVLAGISALAGAAPDVAGELKGESEMEIWLELPNALSQLRRATERELQLVASGYLTISNHLLDPRNPPNVNPDAPKIITDKAFDPGTFTLPDSPELERAANRVDHSSLTPSPEGTGKGSAFDDALNPASTDDR